MLSPKTIFALILLGFSCSTLLAQELKSNLFLRTPQVVNYNFHQNDIGYNPVISIGAGLSYKSEFIELGTFISTDNIYGVYTFFGTTLATVELDDNWKLHTNWFGEISYVPQQNGSNNSFTYTSGLCYFLNYSFDWGSIGLPLCIGLAYNQDNISLNTRTIFNLSINLN